MELTVENVDKMMMSCLFDAGPEDKIPANAVVVEGIVNSFGFDPTKLAKYKEDIVSMLLQLPENFRENSKGKGWSFLAACHRADGELWTGDHMTIEALFCLGIAIGRVKLLLPRDMWNILPGGMPYYSILEEQNTNSPLN